MKKALDARTDLSDAEKENIIKALGSMKDKLLNTANDAWTFMTFYKLQIREQFGLLKKNKLYFIEKSHVTTDGLEEVAKYYRDKGYYVYVVDTYVGFTELAKKSRDMFAVAQTAWQIKELIAQGRDIRSALQTMKERNEVLKANVPYGTAGVEIIDRAINLLDQGDLAEAAELLDIVAHMENLVAVEESNGYGELGEYVPETDAVVNAHISEKDGGLALFEFFEILSYGKAVLGKSGYEMFLDMLNQVGYCATDNQFLKYPGLTGVQEKEDAIEGFEKIFAALIQKQIDAGKSVTLFNGKYTVEAVYVYRDKKYDVSYNGFPEEGIRLVLRTKLGSKAITTFRPSGTGDSNRDYNWIVGLVPDAGTDMEQYRREKIAELEELRKDFFGDFGKGTGYAQLSKDDFYGLLIAVKEAGVSGQIEIFNKVFDDPVDLTSGESMLLTEVKKYTFATRIRKQEYARMPPAQVDTELRKTIQSAMQNASAWEKYLSTEEAGQANAKFVIKANGEILAAVPNHLVKPWMNSLAGYVSEIMISRGLTKAEIETSDPEVTNEIKAQLKSRLAIIAVISRSEAQEDVPAGTVEKSSPGTADSVKAFEHSI